MKFFFFFSLLSAALILYVHAQNNSTSSSESWGYVEVRPKAHMFWWLYKSPSDYKPKTEDPSKPWPTILWLQGGPGGSGVGIGNFEEVGPLDPDLKPRNSTWLKMANLLFVDNPVGTGYSYVEDDGLYVKTDEEAAKDLTTLLIRLFDKDVELQKSPLYIVAESYGGKYAVTLGLSALNAIQAGTLKMKLGGIALGDSWISPEDYVVSWGPLLRDISRIDYSGLQKSDRIVQKIKQQISTGQYEEATISWSLLEDVILENSNRVNFYNFLLDYKLNADSTTSAAAGSDRNRGVLAMKRYSKYLDSVKSTAGQNKGDFSSFMNGVIKEKLKLPANVIWGKQSGLVFDSLTGDFMKPRIIEVDQLLEKGVNVTIYNGQVDLICATKGTQAWVEKLKWGELKTFLAKDRTPLYCQGKRATKGFFKSHNNLQFYWILGAGHFVPVDNPCASLNMVGAITNSPAFKPVRDISRVENLKSF